MRLELDKYGNKIVCGHIYPVQEIEVGSTWIGSGGCKVTVTKVNVEEYEIYYDQIGGAPHHKDAFSFQCRYCLILEEEHD